MKLSVFIATSLDGFIARENGEIDWLEEANKITPKGEDCGFVEFFSSVDALVMGANSYRKVLSFETWPYERKQVIVLSRKGVDVPESLKNKVQVTSETPKELVDRLSKEDYKHLYIDGGMVIQSFLRDNLIDELIITKIPILIGKGKPLFGETPEDIKLNLLGSKVYDFGFVQVKYQVIKN